MENVTVKTQLIHVCIVNVKTHKVKRTTVSQLDGQVSALEINIIIIPGVGLNKETLPSLNLVQH